jgi:predicted nucleic acid-binding protein
MQDSAYIDTSALAKWYFEEENSDQVTSYISKLDTAIISPLVKTEMRCLCARRRRTQKISSMMEMEVFSTFENHIEHGYILLYPMNESTYDRAIYLLNTHNAHPLRTLDALHLATVQLHNIKQLATADKVLAHVAEEMGLEVRFF